ncbi:MAG: LOG family protein, partial [Acidimicrobiales bacterium]|nr:LOG family protein [Acidimicrobiales bacterium]
YVQARDLARAMAAHGWMVITGAGPGIMAAGMEGAGRERSFGVNIRLPHEQEPNAFIKGDPKLVAMKYFFTRKLELIKESDGFVVLPGGFGTLDESFELLTLLQNGKTLPTPVVFLETPGGTYWDDWQRFLAAEVAPRGYIHDHDLDLFLVTEEIDAAVEEIRGFYRNYHSIRWTGTTLVIRLRNTPTDDDIDRLNDEFGDLARTGRIERSGPTGPEAADDDHPELPRLVISFDFNRYGRLRTLIDALNALPSAPVELALPPGHHDPR